MSSIDRAKAGEGEEATIRLNEKILKTERQDSNSEGLGEIEEDSFAVSDERVRLQDILL